MEKLKPCPFCEGKARRQSLDKETHSIYCLNCISSIAWYPTKEEAQIMWNMREEYNKGYNKGIENALADNDN